MAIAEESLLNEDAAQQMREDDLSRRIRDLQSEAQDSRDEYEVEGTGAVNLNDYLGLQPLGLPEQLEEFVVNMTQGAVLATAAIQLDRSPKPIFEAHETNEPPIWYIDEAAGRKVLEAAGMMLTEEGEIVAIPGVLPQIVLEQITPEQILGWEPLDDDHADQIRTLAQPYFDPATGVETPPIIDDKDLIRVDDATAAEFVGDAFKAKWESIDGDFTVLENVIDNAIFGWQPMLVQWCEQEHGFEVINPHQLNCWIDPLSTGIHNARFFILEEVLDEDEAIAKFPSRANLIRAKATTGIHSSVGGHGNTRFRLGAPYRKTRFQRKMVRLTTAWLRNQRFEPMEPEAAIEAGYVQPVMGEPQVTGVNPETDELEVAEPEVVGYEMADTGERTTPGDDNWPARVGILQVQLLDDTVIDSRECPFSDIPLGWNKNVPIPKSPFGQGEPERIRSLQRLINLLYSIMANHFAYYQSPQETMSESMAAALNDPETFAHPSRRFVVPDDLFERMGGKISTQQDPPRLPDTIIKALELCVQLLDRASGRAEVLQGQAPASASGKQVQLLQEAAKGVIGLKSRYLEQMLRHVAKVAAQSMLDWMPESEWQMVSSMPIQIVRAFRARLKNMKWDVAVEVVSGRGATREAEQNKALALFDRGLLSAQTTLEKLEVGDAEGEVQRQREEQQALAPQPAPQAAPAGA